jgi:hypothetical protein
MNLSKLLVVCAVALGGLAVGCGNKCKSECEDSKKCADATDADKNRDCDKACDDLDKVSDAAKCDSQKDKYFDCEDGKDQCATTDSCADQFTAFFTCVGTYCAAHSTDSACTAAAADSGG